MMSRGPMDQTKVASGRVSPGRFFGPLVNLFAHLIFVIAIEVLKRPLKLFSIAVNNIQIVIGKFAPFLLQLTLCNLPFATFQSPLIRSQLILFLLPKSSRMRSQ